MSVYRVGCNQTEHFAILVEADSEEDALEAAYKVLEDEGKPEGASVFERDFDSVIANVQPE